MNLLVYCCLKLFMSVFETIITYDMLFFHIRNFDYNASALPVLMIIYLENDFFNLSREYQQPIHGILCSPCVYLKQESGANPAHGPRLALFEVKLLLWLSGGRAKQFN